MSDRLQPCPLRSDPFGGIAGNMGKETPPMPLSDPAIRRVKPREKPYKVADFDEFFVLVKPSGARL